MTFYDLLWYFTIYSFLGWCSEVIFATVTTGKFVNRGFLNGPVCPIYGFGMSLVLLVLLPFSDNIPLLFIGGALLTSAIELVGGWALKKFFHTTWWDYSDQPFNLGGYICLKFSILWGLCVVVVIRIVHTAIGVARALDSLHARRNSGRYFHRAVYHGYHRHRAYHPQAQQKSSPSSTICPRVCAKIATPSRTASVA